MAKKLKRKKSLPSELDGERRRIFDALAGTSPLACATVGGAYLEHALISLLTAAFIDGKFQDDIEPNEKIEKSKVLPEIFDDGRALGTFAAKIDIAFCLGLITATLRHNLKQLASIRNRFAHSHETIDFHTDEYVKSCCESLQFPKMRNLETGKISDWPRSRFISMVTTISMRLEFTAKRVRHATLLWAAKTS